MKLYNAKITEISGKGVRVSYPTMEKPEKYHYIQLKNENQLFFNIGKYRSAMKTYKSSFATKKVENIDRVSEDSEYWIIFPIDSNMSYEYPLKINQSCQVIETKTGVKIIKIN